MWPASAPGPLSVPRAALETVSTRAARTHAAVPATLKACDVLYHLPADEHWLLDRLAFPRKGAKRPRRLARCLGIAWDAVRFLNRDWAEVRSGPD